MEGGKGTDDLDDDDDDDDGCNREDTEEEDGVLMTFLKKNLGSHF